MNHHCLDLPHFCINGSCQWLCCAEGAEGQVVGAGICYDLYLLRRLRALAIGLSPCTEDWAEPLGWAHVTPVTWTGFPRRRDSLLYSCQRQAIGGYDEQNLNSELNFRVLPQIPPKSSRMLALPLESLLHLSVFITGSPKSWHEGAKNSKLLQFCVSKCFVPISHSSARGQHPLDV